MSSAVPKVVVFDLDGCVWDPEMYQLWGGGAPFAPDGRGNLIDKAGIVVRLLGAVREVSPTLHCVSHFSVMLPQYYVM